MPKDLHGVPIEHAHWPHESPSQCRNNTAPMPRPNLSSASSGSDASAYPTTSSCTTCCGSEEGTAPSKRSIPVAADKKTHNWVTTPQNWVQLGGAAPFTRSLALCFVSSCPGTVGNFIIFLYSSLEKSEYGWREFRTRALHWVLVHHTSRLPACLREEEWKKRSEGYCPREEESTGECCEGKTLSYLCLIPSKY